MCVFLHVGTHHTVGRICVWSHTMKSSLLHPGGDITAAVGRGILELQWPSDDINPRVGSSRTGRDKKAETNLRLTQWGGLVRRRGFGGRCGEDEVMIISVLG